MGEQFIDIPLYGLYEGLRYYLYDEKIIVRLTIIPWDGSLITKKCVTNVKNEENLIDLCIECHDYVEIKTYEWIQSGKSYDINILKSMILNDGFE